MSQPTNTTPLRWYCVPNPPDLTAPEWFRSLAIDATGTVYAPAAFTGNETAAILAASWDGDVRMILDRNHAYLPCWWIAREYPAMADVCRLIELQANSPPDPDPEPARPPGDPP